MRSAMSAWYAYWFSPGAPGRIVPFRVVLSLISILWMVSYFAELSIWFGETGILNTAVGGKLVAFEEISAWQVWSPLWWTDSLILYQAWLGMGICLAVMTAIGIGGRWTVGILIVCIIAWAHRTMWLSGLVEPVLIAWFAYLLVDPGPSLRSVFQSRDSRETSWTSRVVLRLVQTHWWLLVAFTFMSQLGDVVWWRGDAAWWLAASEKSFLLSIDGLRGKASVVNAITHAVIAIEAIALWLIIPKSTRLLGMICGLLACLSIALIADQLLFGLLLSTGLLVFDPSAKASRPSAN